MFVREVARAEAMWCAATAAAESCLSSVLDDTCGPPAATTDTRVTARLVATHAAHVGAAVVRRCADLAGADAIRWSEPVARCHRDGTILDRHGVVSEQAYDLLGRVQLGLEPDSAMV